MEKGKYLSFISFLLIPLVMSWFNSLQRGRLRLMEHQFHPSPNISIKAKVLPLIDIVLFELLISGFSSKF